MFQFKKNELQEIPVEQIVPNPDQPRKVFKKNELDELAESIKEIGVIQPIIIKKLNDKEYILIAGERRLRASKMAGLKNIPVIIKNVEQNNEAIWALVENIQREELNYLEEAMAYKKLMEKYHLTQIEIAKRIGKKQSTISNKMRILNLPDFIRNQLIDNGLTERHARSLLKLSDQEDIQKALYKIIDNELNVKETEKLIDSIINRKKKRLSKKRVKRCINYKIYVNTLKKAFKTIYEVEQSAEYKQKDKGEYMEILIKIPKNEQ